MQDVGDWLEQAANHISGGLEKTWDWVSDDENWAALIQTVLISADLALADGEWETSWDLFTDSNSYWAQAWYDQEAHPALYEWYDEHDIEMPTGRSLISNEI